MSSIGLSEFHEDVPSKSSFINSLTSGLTANTCYSMITHIMNTISIPVNDQ